MLELQPPWKCSPFDAIHPLRLFPLLKTVFELVNSDVVQCCCRFCFTSSTSAVFPLRAFFIPRNKQTKGRSGQDWVNRKGGAQVSWSFLVKNFWSLSAVWAGPLINHPSGNGQTHWKSPQKKKNSLKPHAASHNNVVLAHWYRWVPRAPPGRGRLYHNGPALQKVLPGWGVPLLSISRECVRIGTGPEIGPEKKS